MADVFLSYSSEDRLAAQAIAQALSARGRSVWWDRSIRAGEDFFDVIERQLDVAKCVVVLWSKTSVASRWVRAEATEALNQGKLIPVLVDECRPPLVFRQIQQVSTDAMGRLDSAAAVDALEREIEARLRNLDEVDKLSGLPAPARTRVAAAAARTDARVPMPEVSSEALVVAFLKGARLDFSRDEMGDLDRLFGQIGEIVRESIEGAGNFLRAQVYLKDELRIEKTMIAPRRNNPLKFVADYQSVARVLLLQRNDGFVDAPAALREALQDAQDSFLAHVNAMRASLAKAIDLLGDGTAEEHSSVPEALWPWAETRRLRQMLRRQADRLAALRKEFDDGEGPIMDTYSRTYRAQMQTLRDDRYADAQNRKKERTSGDV